jgi:transcriptional regulator with XRE-family HTH domain
MIAGLALRGFVLDESEDVRLGREVVVQERLKPLRLKLGLTRSAMAELLHTSMFTYSSWELRPNTALWPSTAGRIGRFYTAATKQLILLEQEAIAIEELVPLHIASSMLGIPQELLLQWYRQEKFEAVDLGILGLWLWRDEVKDINR